MYRRPKLNFDKDFKTRSSMPVFECTQVQQRKQAQKSVPTQNHLTNRGTTTNQFAKWTARLWVTLFIIMLISILIISVFNLI